MAITNESKETLKTSVDIVDVISDHLELKKAGANFKACCPFHGESTPSFVVSPSKQIYHCFGCGAGGDVFKFVQEFNKVSFVEAVEDVAARHNFTLQYEGGGGERKDYSRVMDAVLHYYMKGLRDSDREYLKSRGLSAKTMKEWQIGWAPRTPEQLKALDGMLLPSDDLLELGIVGVDGGRKYARFSERIMFPIHNHMGKCVGFSGRSLKEGAKAKYLNSPQSKLFDKSSVLFGFDKAKEHIYKKKFAVVMEGQLDVILSHQIGIQTAIATQGTALTEGHLPQLRKAGAKIILAYDGDKAGRAAALKAAVLLSRNGFAGGVALFPEGMDPADLIRDGREDEVKRLIRSWADLVKFVLHTSVSNFNVTDPYQKNEALKICVDFLKSLKNDMIAQEYVGYLASLLDIEKEYVQLGSIPAPIPTAANNEKASSEDLLLYSMYWYPSWVDAAVDVVDDAAWENKTCYKALLENKQNETLFASILLKDDIAVLSESQFAAALKQKQKSYLQALRSRMQAAGAAFEEILKINERMKVL